MVVDGLTDAQFRTLKKYLSVLGKEYPGIELNEYTRGQKAGFRQVLALFENPKLSLSHVVENNLDRIATR